MPSLPNPYQIPKEAEGICGRPQIFNVGDGPHEQEDLAPEASRKLVKLPKQELLVISSPLRSELQSVKPMMTSQRRRKLSP